MTRLTTHPLPAGAKPAQPEYVYARATMEDPATAVMTDLARHRAVIAHPGEALEHAERRMISVGVRLLLVVDREGSVVGVLSHRDIVGQKATAEAVREGVSHQALAVSAVMTPLAEVEALDYAAVKKASVLDLVRLMHERGRQHALATETDAEGKMVVRGIFSITQIGRQLGITIEAGERVQSFSEIEHLIAAA
ncbi:MAG: CBS domain-containing protein [Gammaproteobacteria bacterium]